MKTKIENSIRGLLFVPLLLGCFAILPRAGQAAPDPAPPPGNNTRDGEGAMANITTGQFNTAFGTNALNSLTTGNNNSAQGNSALFSLTTGGQNIGVGNLALRLNTTGSQNVGVGAGALYSNLTGARNVAVGHSVLQNSTANDNTAVGWLAASSDTTGQTNTAIGSEALRDTTTGNFNTAVGSLALQDNVSGTGNTAVGRRGLESSNGSSNTAVGYFALDNITTGSNNTAIGYNAGGHTTGSNNTSLGFSAGNSATTASNVVCIGQGTSGENFSDRAYIRNIGLFAQATTGTIDFVTVRLSDGKLGHVASSRRYKEDIKLMDNASELIYKLKPVTFRFKEQDVDPNKGPQPQNLDYGLIAEEVAEIDPKLAIRDGNGQIESVRYMAIYNMMLNEFIKEHQKVQQLESNVALQQKEMRVLTAQLKEQAAQIQKVSAQLDVNKPAPRTVASK